VLENKKCALVGYGGHALVVADSYIESGGFLNYYTNTQAVLNNPFKLAYLGCEIDSNFKGWEMNLTFILGIGDNHLRQKIANLILSKSHSIGMVIDSSSVISKSANLGLGVFLSKGVLVNAFSEIGNFTILNTGCIIEHECKIGAASHIAPGAVLAGNVKVGERTFIGANSVIKQGIEIGNDVIIGAGAVIIENIRSNTKIVGNPGRIIN